MRKFVSTFLIFVLLFVSVFSLSACTDNKDYWIVVESFDAFGVDVGMQIGGTKARKSAAEVLFEEFKVTIQQADNEMSTSISTSDIARFNRAAKDEKIYIGEHTKAVYDMAKDLYEESDGFFDPAVFNLVDYWGFAPYGAAIINPPGEYGPMHPSNRYYDTTFKCYSPAEMVPELKKVSNFKNAVCGEDSEGWYLVKTDVEGHPYSDIEFEGKTYTLRIDFGAIAKGYAADVGAELAKEHGFSIGYINANSSKYLLTGGKNGGEETGFPISITDPRDLFSRWFDVSIASFNSTYKNTGLSTSGDYEKTYEHGGATYSHLINPKTGWPVNINPENGKGYNERIISVTMLNTTGTLSDGLATVPFAMGTGGEAAVGQAIDWLEGRDASSVVFIEVVSGSTVTYKVICINLPEDAITIREGEPQYQIISKWQ